MLELPAWDCFFICIFACLNSCTLCFAIQWTILCDVCQSGCVMGMQMFYNKHVVFRYGQVDA